jgi:hypothetical protein
VYLKGHAGDTLRVDRIGRAPEYVKEPAITVGLAVQPDVIHGLADHPGFRERGLLGRFLYSLPVSMLGHRDTNAPAVPRNVRTAYHDNVLALLRIRLEEAGNGDFTPHVLSLDPTGRDRLREFEEWLEPQLAEFGDLGGITDWASKLVGAITRIAGLLHMAEHIGKGSSWMEPISDSTIESAISIGRYLIPHAKAAFAHMGADETVEKAKALLRWITHNNLDSFTKRDAHQGTRSKFKRAEDICNPLSLLVDHGFIRKQKETSYAGPGRHPSPTYDVNPLWVRNSQRSGYGASF